MDKSTHEEHLSLPLQTSTKQFKLAVTFLTGYNGIFNVKSKNFKLYFTRSINDDDFTQLTIPPGLFEIESLNKEIKPKIIEQSHFTEDTYPFEIKPYFGTLGNIIEISSKNKGTQISFTPNKSIGDLVGFKPKVIYEEYIVSVYPVVILSSDNIFLESDITQGMIFEGKRSGVFHIWTMTVNPGYKYVEFCAGSNSWLMMDTKQPEILS